MEEFIVDRKSAVPPYRQLSNHLSKILRLGKFKSGSKLPSIRQMMTMYSLSNVTVQKALQQLKTEGLIAGRSGDGMVVATPPRPTPVRETVPELWVESFRWLEGNEARFLNRFHSLYPHVSVVERSAGDVNWLGIDYLPIAARSHEDVTELALEAYGRAESGRDLFEKLFVNGRLYLLPLRINVPVVACNVKVFEEMGVDLPSPEWNWDEFLRIGRALTRPGQGRYGFATRWASWDSFVPYVWQAGGRLFERSGAHCLPDTDATLEAARFIRHWREFTAPIPAIAVWDSFAAHTVGMMTLGVTGYALLNKRGCRWVARRLPKGRYPGTPLLALGYGLSRRSPHRAGAMDFMRETAAYEAWPENRENVPALPLHRRLEKHGETERTYRTQLHLGRGILSDIDPECRQPVHGLIREVISSYHMRPLIFGDEPVEYLVQRMTMELNNLVALAGSYFAMM